MDTNREEQSIVIKVQEGDKNAYKKLYDTYVARIYALTYRMVPYKHAAEDLTQDIFIRAWEKIGTYSFKSSFYTWLHRLAVNVIMRKSQKLKKRELAESEVEIETLGRQTSGENNTGIEIRIDCERALLKLPDKARKIFVLHEIEGLTHEEIKTLTGISIGTSKAHLFRARKLLKKELNYE